MSFLGNTVRKSKKKIIVVSVIILAVAGLGVGGWYGYQYYLKQSAINKYSSLSVEEKAVENTNLFEKVDTKAAKGDYAGAMQLLNEALAIRAKVEDKVDIYFKKATVAQNMEKYDDAYAAAEEAEKLLPSDQTAYILAQIAEAKNDRSDAIAKYELFVSRFKPQDPLDLSTLVNVKNKIEALKK